MRTARHSPTAYLWRLDPHSYLVTYSYRAKPGQPPQVCQRTKRRYEWAAAWLSRMGYTRGRSYLDGAKEEWVIQGN